MEGEQVTDDATNEFMMTQDHLRVDPRDLRNLGSEMNIKTLNVYKKTWIEFVNMSGISVDNEPDENDFLTYFEKKRSSGCLGNTLRCNYSHLNKIYTQLYGMTLSSLSRRIFKVVEEYSKGERIKKGKIFKREEVLR